MTILSGYDALRLLAARGRGDDTATISTDLNKTRTEARLDAEGAAFGDPEQRVGWETVVHMSRHGHRCYQIGEDGAPETVTVYSETTARQCSLYALEDGAPTMMLAGFPMHRIKNTDPWADTLAKLAAASPVSGRVLDTTMGLGYTAIGAAPSALSVTTIELDPGVVEIARRNPWSADLFDNPRIERRIGDATQVVPTFPEGSFDLVLHDPPTVQLAGELYGEPFYRALLRVLSRRGRLFHYVGSPDSRQGAILTKGVVRRLKEAGFARVQPERGAFGVVAYR